MIQYAAAFRFRYRPAITGYPLSRYDEGRWLRILPPVRPHPLDHLLDMRDRRFRLDAVAEVEDQPAAGVICKHVVDRLVQRGAAGDQRQWIEIALDGHNVLYPRADQ